MPQVPDAAAGLIAPIPGDEPLRRDGDDATDACQYFYNCKGCGAVLKPKAGDCCVYCSYGSVLCPPIPQGNCCSWASPTQSLGRADLSGIIIPPKTTPATMSADQSHLLSAQW
jgi:hypothetical protein